MLELGEVLFAEGVGVHDGVDVRQDPEGKERADGQFFGPVKAPDSMEIEQVLQCVPARVPTVERRVGTGVVEAELAVEGEGEEVPRALVEGRHVGLERLLADQVVAVRAKLVVPAVARPIDEVGHAAVGISLGPRIAGCDEQGRVAQVVGLEEAFRIDFRLRVHQIQALPHVRVQRVLVVPQFFDVAAIEGAAVANRAGAWPPIEALGNWRRHGRRHSDWLKLWRRAGAD